MRGAPAESISPPPSPGALRVCLDARLISGREGGVETVVIGMVHGLSQLKDGGEEYFVLAFDGHIGWLKPFLSDRFRLISIPPPPLPGVRRLLRPLRTLRDMASYMAGPRTVVIARSDGTIERHGIDIMHFLHQKAFITNVASIYHPHDLQHRHLPQFFSGFDKMQREVRYRRFCEQAKLVAVVSEFTRKDVIEAYALPPEKVQVVHWGSVLEAYEEPTPAACEEVRRKFSLPENFIFFPAQTWPHKNHIGLLRALALLRERNALLVPLVCSGRCSEFFSEIEDAMRRLNLQKDVRFTGFVSPRELRTLYRLARAVVVPTLFEAASGPVAEAFAAGVPVACSNACALPEQAGDAALLFDPAQPKEIAEAVRRLWTDESLWASLIERGKKRVTGQSWEKTARIFRAHYRQIAGRPLSAEDMALLAQ